MNARLLQRRPPWPAVRRDKSVEVSYSNRGDKNQRDKRRYASVSHVLTVLYFLFDCFFLVFFVFFQGFMRIG